MADRNLLDTWIGPRSVMEPQRPAWGESLLGFGGSLARSGASLADLANMAMNPVYASGSPAMGQWLESVIGPSEEGRSEAYRAGGLLGDIAQMVTPAGLLGRGASAATKAVPSSLARQTGAILPKRGPVDPVEASLMSLRGHQPAFKYPVGAPSNPSGQKIADAFDPTGKTVFQQEVDGSASFWNPQTNARVYVRPDEGGRMFINAQESAPGQDSGRLWQMAQQYMRNQGIREITDPAGYTPAGGYRSISHGISSAIRNDDASHLGAMAERNMPTLRTMADTESKLIRERLDSAGAVNEMIDKGRLRFDMSDGRLKYQDSPKRPVTDYTQADFLTDFGRQGMSDTSVGYDSLRRALLYEQLRRLKEPVDLRPLVKSPLLYGAGVPVLTGGLLGPPDTP